MKRLDRAAVLVLLASFDACESTGGGRTSASSDLDRTVLPVPEPDPAPIRELDARNATAPPPFKVEAPAGAPNVVVVLIDDIGFGTASMFGGGIDTPTLDRLAGEGVRFDLAYSTTSWTLSSITSLFLGLPQERRQRGRRGTGVSGGLQNRAARLKPG